MDAPASHRFLSFGGRPEHDEGEHPERHVTVPHGRRVVFSYQAEGFQSVQLFCCTRSKEAQVPSDGAPDTGEVTDTPEADCTYLLVGITADGTKQRSWPVLVDVHDEKNPVSGVAFVAPRPVASPLETHCLLLCGPMLRRVESAQGGAGGHVCVFVATQKPCEVQLRVYAGGPIDAGGPPAALGEASAQTLPLGPALHVALVDLRGLTLEPGGVFSYDVAFLPGDHAPTETLATLGLLTGAAALGYHDGRLPSFLAPPATPQELRLLHGSCRKAHGQGEDALLLADRLIEGEFTPRLGPRLGSPRSLRPHQLLLTGDQIYADDLPVALCALVHTREAQLLCPWWVDGEKPAAPDLRFLDCPSGRYEPGQQRAHKHKRAFPSVPSGLPAHLFFLGEFLVHYLLAFSPELWPKDSAGQPTLDWAQADAPPDEPEPAESKDPEPRGPLAPSPQRAEDRFRASAAQFGRHALYARRVLANVPTLMICDDHEVTNNWNLDAAWVDNLRSAPLAKRVVRNALCAYALFQDWGNRPEHYAEGGPGRPILDGLALRKFDDDADRPAQIIEEPALLDALLLPPFGAGGATAGTLHFDYTIEFPSHRLVLLDTRTSREFPPDPPGSKGQPGTAGAGLVSSAGLDRMLPPPSTAQPDGKLTVVVSAVPVFSTRLAEGALAAFARAKGVDDADHESWPINPAAYHRLLERLAAFRSVVVLSGDVHYSFSAQVGWLRKDGPARIVQFCSSAIKNQNTPGAVVKGLNTLAPDPALGLQTVWTLTGFPHRWLSGGPEVAAADLERAGASLTQALAALPQRLLAGPGAVALHSLRAALRSTQPPDLSLLPLWATEKAEELRDATLQAARAAVVDALGGELLRLDFLTDPSLDLEQICLTPLPDSRAPAGPELWVNRGGTRTIVDFNNIALVTFTAGERGPTKAVQTLLWKLQELRPSAPLGGSDLQDTATELRARGEVGHTVHEASLAPPGADEFS